MSNLTVEWAEDLIAMIGVLRLAGITTLAFNLRIRDHRGAEAEMPIALGGDVDDIVSTAQTLIDVASKMPNWRDVAQQYVAANVPAPYNNINNMYGSTGALADRVTATQIQHTADMIRNYQQQMSSIQWTPPLS